MIMETFLIICIMVSYIFKVLEFVDDHGNFPYNIMMSYVFKVLEFVDDHGNEVRFNNVH